MGKIFDGVDSSLASWIAAQQVFFVASAPLAADGHVNVSPRSQDAFAVLTPHRVGWVDYTGSGIETIAHLRENGRICLMWCSFDKRPRIVRLHGTGRVAMPGTPEFDDVASRFPEHPSTRAVILVDVHRTSDSCGYGVPRMDLVEEVRPLMRLDAEKRGPDGMVEYREKKNARSLDGLPGLPGL